MSDKENQNDTWSKNSRGTIPISNLAPVGGEFQVALWKTCLKEPALRRFAPALPIEDG